ncbi:MAG: DUF2231 domain-containing protein [Bacteroidetes bacterium]|nr:DUF2231 domain-containing protein [Bacteroidota bacterium]
MKLLGHPIHIILIHFPSALLPLDVLFSVLALYLNKTELCYVSACMTLSGAAFGWLAITTGLFDLTHIADKKPDHLKKALVHGGINTVVLIGYSVLAFMVYKKMPLVTYDSMAILVTKIVLVLTLIVGNFIGAELILKHKVLD